MERSRKIRTAVSIFLIAFAFGLNITGISPILGVLNEKYSEYGTSMVQLLQTLPYLLLMLGSLLIGWWTTKASKKKIVLLGLLIIGFCGIVPFFSEQFWVLFLSRLLIGFGFGIMGPMNTAIISELFEEQERAGYMGLHVVGMGVGTMAGNLLGGILSGISFRYFYLAYLIAFISWGAVQFLLEETPPVKIEKASEMKLNAKVYALSFSSFAHTLFINAYSMNVGIYILQNITEDTTVTGAVTTINAVFALMCGAFFAKISGLLKQYTVAGSILSAAAGYGALLVLPGMAGVYIASALCGVSLSCFMAGASMQISVSVEPNAVAKASGVFSIIGGIGGLIAPAVLGNAASLLLGENSAVNQFRVACFGMLLLGILMLIAAMRSRVKRGQ
nr:MFS transporter [uncultured Schaedlerella sp.]